MGDTPSLVGLRRLNLALGLYYRNVIQCKVFFYDAGQPLILVVSFSLIMTTFVSFFLFSSPPRERNGFFS